MFVTENPVYSTFSQTASKLLWCNFKLAASIGIILIQDTLSFSFIGFRHVTFRPDPVERPFVHVTQKKQKTKKRQKHNFQSSFKNFLDQKYLRQQNDNISANVQFHGCFKSFIETLGKILKVLLLTHIFISTYSTRAEEGGDHEALHFTSCWNTAAGK